MIGFIVGKNTAEAILEGVKQAQLSRDVPFYWSPGMYEIFSGEHTGLYFIPFDDIMTNTVLRTGQRPINYPEFNQLMAILGGMENRIEIEASTISKEG